MNKHTKSEAKLIKQTLEKLGFKMHVYEGVESPQFATIAAESYSVGKNHFTPRSRHVYVSTAMYPTTIKNFYYITSNISGMYRGYRCKNSYETEIGNIYASGKTVKEALELFVYNFTHKIYNTPLNRQNTGYNIQRHMEAMQ